MNVITNSAITTVTANDCAELIQLARSAGTVRGAAVACSLGISMPGGWGSDSAESGSICTSVYRVYVFAVRQSLAGAQRF